MRKLLSALLDLMVPPRRTERIVRALTLRELQNIATEDGLPYHDPRVTALVWELKYYATAPARRLAGAYLAEPLLALVAEEVGAPLFIPIPMHPARRKERGHNQTEILCRAALGALGDVPLEYRPDALERVAYTRHQQGLPRHVRARNVRHSMRADKTVVAGRACIVLDDVETTGATLEEAKRALLAAGARAVHCLALAKS